MGRLSQILVEVLTLNQSHFSRVTNLQLVDVSSLA
jgi:hypothetical protein